MMKRIFTLLMVLAINYIAFGQSNNCNCDFTINSKSNYRLYPADLVGIKAGDTICLEDRTVPLELVDIVGSKEAPIVVINCGTMVTLPSLKFTNCRYFKVTGSGDDAIQYGIKLGGKPWGLGVSMDGLSSDFELERLKIGGYGSVLGIVAKKDYGGTPPTPLPVFENLIIHDNYIDSIPGGVGIYIGETKSPGMLFKHVRVYNNKITNIAREPIQVANSVEDIEVYNNICYNAGMIKMKFQGNNLQVGGESTGWYYNNVLLKGYEYGIICFGNDDLNFFSNYLDENLGMYISAKGTLIPEAEIHIENNTFGKTYNTKVIDMNSPSSKIYINDNRWLGEGVFTQKCCGMVDENLFIKNNIIKNSIVPFDTLNPDFSKFTEMGIGPITGLKHKMNYTTERKLAIVEQNTVHIERSKPITIILSAANRDKNTFILEAIEIPSFATFKDNKNGTASVTFNLEAKTITKNKEHKITIEISNNVGQTNTMSFNAITDIYDPSTDIKNISNIQRFIVSDNIFITLNTAMKGNVEILNAMGQKLYEKNFISNEITINKNDVKLPQGLIIVNIISTEKCETKSFINYK